MGVDENLSESPHVRSYYHISQLSVMEESGVQQLSQIQPGFPLL